MNYIPTEVKYEIIAKIGEGGYGVIYKAREISTTNIVSLKQFKKQFSHSDKKIPKSILSEINILQELKGQSNVINIRDIQKFKNNLFIVYEYNEFDLNKLIYQKQSLTIQQIKSYMKQMIISLQAVHSKGYIHCDIKPGNFLISYENEIKLIDFGVSTKIEDENKEPKIGTLYYNAPELILGDTNYDVKIDIWSLGCTLYEMITKKKYMFSSYCDYEIAKQMVHVYGIPRKQDYPQFFCFPNTKLFLNFIKCSNMTLNEFFDRQLPDKYKSFKNLLIGLLQFNPKDRISLEDALNDPVLSDAELPKNLPLIVLKESDSVSSKNQLFKNGKNLCNHLRPSKTVPPNFI